ncbi:small GTP-binding protein [Tritrichomonas foetus]|uniref:Small GTP-binding protein n=1 Tax=Tritrichomonas foetus TaxID=1144522 RepID=A0A1J4KJ12_9EUKA|nr:small GTP-binding protein [Tritrichomonas foetus]|eukprot:OHT11227.1 small GTP-binding protein [Tritrichomonas foetus]
MKRIRAVLCGEASVGKSSILRRFSENVFFENSSTTIAGAFLSRFVELNHEVINLEIWDTAGSERYHSVIPSFFKNAGVVAIVYDITSRQSFENLPFWVDFAISNSPVQTPIFIVGNKADLYDRRNVTFEEAKAFSNHNHAAGFIETSAKTGEQIEGLFTLLASVPPSGQVELQEITNVINLEGKKNCC